MSNYNNNYTYSRSTKYSGDPGSRQYQYPSASGGQGGTSYTNTMGASPRTTAEEDTAERRWDVEVRAGSFDGDTTDPATAWDHDSTSPPRYVDNSHAEYANEWIDNMEAPVGYGSRWAAGNEQQFSSPPTQPRRDVQGQGIDSAQYPGAASSSSSGPTSGQNSSSSRSRSSKSRHGNKVVKRRTKDNKH